MGFIGLVKTALKNGALAAYAVLVTGLETLLDRKQGPFIEWNFFECLLIELFNTPIALQLVFTSTLTPRVSESLDRPV